MNGLYDNSTITTADVRAAGAAIRGAIAEAEGPLPPAFILEFLLRNWRRYLVRLHALHGDDSAEWKAATTTTSQLLRSIAPLHTQEERTRLLHLLPTLLADLRTGIALSEMETAARDAFLEQLRSAHMRVLEAPFEPLDRDAPDLSETIAVNIMDPRQRELLDRLDGLDSLDDIESIDV